MFRMKPLFNKKAVSLPIFLLVITLILLLMFSLIIFYKHKQIIREDISLPEVLDEFYIQKILLESNLREIFNEASEDFASKEDFIKKFSERLKYYRDSNENYLILGFKDIEEQIVEENIELVDNELVLRLNVSLEENFVEEKYDVIFKSRYDLVLEKSP